MSGPHRRRGGGDIRRTARRRPSVRWLALLPAVALAVGILAAAGGGEPAHRVPNAVLAPGADPVPDASRFYGEVRLALSPLLQHVRVMAESLRRLEAEPASETLAGVATRWADDGATARDLVARLRAPAGPVGVEIRDLYQTAAMLDVEAARAAARAAAAASVVDRRAAARSGQRLLLLRDRVLDLAKRALDVNGEIVPPELVMPAEVPDFRAEGLDADHPGPPGPERSGFADRDVATAPEFFVAERGRLGEAVAVLDGTRAAFAHPSAAAAPPSSRAARLQAVVSELGASVPVGKDARGGAVALRLALLVDAEALRTLAAGEPAVVQAQRLRLIGERLWNSGLHLAARGGAPGLPSPERVQLPSALLDEGGAFGGHPPALRPGDGPGAGVPGGLPEVSVDPVFGG